MKKIKLLLLASIVLITACNKESVSEDTPEVYSCQAEYTDCSGFCRDLDVDFNNCGSCDNICSSGEVCSSGICSLTCQENYTECNGGCSDIQSDRKNCGTCGNACA